MQTHNASFKYVVHTECVACVLCVGPAASTGGSSPTTPISHALARLPEGLTLDGYAEAAPLLFPIINSNLSNNQQSVFNKHNCTHSVYECVMLSVITCLIAKTEHCTSSMDSCDI
jgi:hypothetical protein